MPIRAPQGQTDLSRTDGNVPGTQPTGPPTDQHSKLSDQHLPDRGSDGRADHGPRWRAPLAAARSRLAAVSGPGWTVAVAALLSAVAAVLINQHLFPYQSINNDEALYWLQAQTLAGGDLFPPAPPSADSYAPWLAIVTDGHYVLKYTPVVAGLLALSLVITGGTALALALVVAAAVEMTYLVGVELLDDRRTAAVAAWLLALSPLVLLQSAMLLPYLPVLVLSECVVFGLLRGLRTRRRVPLVGAGLALGLAAAVRPYDVVLVLGPFVLWTVCRGARGRRWWMLRWVGAGLAAPFALLLSYNAAATGNPFQLPFALLEPEDKLGFGVRRLFPTDTAHHFGLVEGLTAIGDHLWLLGAWACGGVVLAVLSVATVIRRRMTAPALTVGVGALLLIIGYVAFWGAWNAAELWGGTRCIGPFYLMPVLVTLVLFGARGLVDMASAWPRTTGLVAVAGLALSGFILVVASQDNMEFTQRDRNLSNMINARPGPTLVIVSVDPAFLMHPTSVVANSPTLDDRVLYAVSRKQADFDVVADHPDRSPYLLRLAIGYNRTLSSPSAGWLERLRVVDGVNVAVGVSAAVPAGTRAARIEVTADGRRSSFSMNPDRPLSSRLIISPGGVDATALGPRSKVSDVPTTRDVPAMKDDRSVTLKVFYTPAGDGRERLLDQVDLPVRVDSRQGTVSVLVSEGQVGAVGSGAMPTIRLRAS
ncbi:hypothetical protein FsymDg_1481 [Candidatus Protofrankia datiscae]|uniref:DUF7846 domain-containing protein n=2 Tax=Candidatus Protofrankia datiscae TaxID=2716812 RepID=F8B2W1_9ACTN|nr:hypothetical protein [Candidatus Protofrankia datiscae]AEH08943.1 hypothetical protein FsymDg_1481 [Candidatus Protofrankia datiscae]